MLYPCRYESCYLILRVISPVLGRGSDLSAGGPSTIIEDRRGIDRLVQEILQIPATPLHTDRVHPIPVATSSVAPGRPTRRQIPRPRLLTALPTDTRILLVLRSGVVRRGRVSCPYCSGDRRWSARRRPRKQAVPPCPALRAAESTSIRSRNRTDERRSVLGQRVGK